MEIEVNYEIFGSLDKALYEIIDENNHIWYVVEKQNGKIILKDSEKVPTIVKQNKFSIPSTQEQKDTLKKWLLQ